MNIFNFYSYIRYKILNKLSVTCHLIIVMVQQVMAQPPHHSYLRMELVLDLAWYHYHRELAQELVGKSWGNTGILFGCPFFVEPSCSWTFCLRASRMLLARKARSIERSSMHLSLPDGIIYMLVCLLFSKLFFVSRKDLFPMEEGAQ